VASLLQSAETYASVSLAADVDAAVAADANLRLMGFSAWGALICRIVDGATGAGGSNLVFVDLGATETDTRWFGPNGISARDGLSIDWTSGAGFINLHWAIAK
jgi:hypothetical protein